jgi:hypothetical protein
LADVTRKEEKSMDKPNSPVVPFTTVPKEIFRACVEAVKRRPEIEALMTKVFESAPKDKPWGHEPIPIKSRRKAQKKFRELVFRNMWPSVSVNLVIIGDTGSMKLSSVTVDGTPMNKLLGIGAGTDLTGLSHTRYTEDMIKVRLTKPNTLGEGNAEDMSVFINDSFVIAIIDNVRQIFRVHEGKVIDCSGKQLSDEESERVFSNAYRCFNFGASQSDTTAGDRKKWQYTLLADWPVDIPKAKAALTMGMSSLLVTPNEKGAIAKASTRLTQYMASTATGSKLLCYAVYMGKFPYGDGAGHVTGEYLARVLMDLSGNKYTVEPDLVVGLAPQSRPNAAKSLQCGKTHNWVLRLIDRALKDGSKVSGMDEPVVLVRSKVSTMDLVKYVMACMKMGPWYGRTIIIAETEAIARNWKQHIEAVFDLNAIKAQTDPALPAYFPVMDVSHEVEDKAHGFSLSTQFLEKFCNFDLELAEKFVTLAFRREFVEMKERWSKGAMDSISVDDLADPRTLLEKIAPSARGYIRPIFDSKIKDILKTLNSRLGLNSKVGLSVPGEYRDLIPDPLVEVMGLDYKVLKMANGVAEVIMPGIEPGTELVAVRYPSSGYWSYVRFIVISAQEYVDRVKHMGAPKDIVKDIEKIIHNMNEGNVIVPASDALCSTLDGSDFDGDHCSAAECAKKSDDFVNLKMEEINSLDDLEWIEELLKQAIKLFYDSVDPVNMKVVEF